MRSLYSRVRAWMCLLFPVKTEAPCACYACNAHQIAADDQRMAAAAGESEADKAARLAAAAARAEQLHSQAAELRHALDEVHGCSDLLSVCVGFWLGGWSDCTLGGGYDLQSRSLLLVFLTQTIPLSIHPLAHSPAHPLYLSPPR